MAVRVKVKKCEPNLPPEWRKFSVDPQITSLEVLYSLLQKAFELKSDFSIKYKAFDPAGNEIYLAVLSDWDLDAAFLRIHNLSIQTATEPCLMLQIDIKPFTEVREWDAADTPTVSAVRSNSSGSASSVLSPSFSSGVGGGSGARELMSPLQQSFGASQKYVQHMQTKLPGLIMNQMEKTFSIVQKAFNLSEETMASLPPRAPLADNEFRLFLDALGQIQRSDELRKVIFFGGIDPSLRRVVWKHILNVYPSVMNGHQRMDYMRNKSEQYYRLRDIWKTAVKQGCVVGELAYVTSMVKKDVLRTDRLHPFYAGSDDNQNIASLFNILTTYALNHPSVSYCQGMSDLASPLLVTMNDEAQAYICFCAIMARVRGNFMLDGVAMTQKFSHLTEALSFYDPEFWEYLKSQQADDLLFCYRWLLLELKREFPFEDALRMLEVQWSSLKYDTSGDKELRLYEREFVPIAEISAPTTSSSFSSSFGAAPISPSYLVAKPRENPYTKVCALRRQSSSASLSSLSSSLGNNANMLLTTKLDHTKRLNQSLDDNISQHVTRRHRHASSKAHQSLDEAKMLMLIEHAQDADNKDSALAATADELEDVDDDVFTNTAANSNNSNGETNHFDFHPTNPFKDDVQLHGKVLPSKAQKSPQTKVFLNSTSSTIAEDESVSESDIKVKLPKGIAKLHNQNVLSNYNAVSSIIAKQMASAASVGESVRRVGSTAVSGSTGGGGHFKELKEKIAATSRKAGMCMSFDDASNASVNEKSQQKLVKNFNEFLNFASINKSRIADKLSTSTANSNSIAMQSNEQQRSNTPSPTRIAAITTTIATHVSTSTHPLVQLTKSGFSSASLDESDSSSVPDTTWSGSTAATAIQQGNNLSNQSLHLELSSLSSAAHTPDRTPTFERMVDEKQESTASPQKARTPHDVGLTPDDSQDQEYFPMTTAITRELRLEAENLDRQVFGEVTDATQQTFGGTSCDIEYEKLGKDSLDMMEDLKENEIRACPDLSELLLRRRKRDAKARSSIEPLQHVSSEFDAITPWPSHPRDGNLNLPAYTTAASINVTEATAASSSVDTLQLNPFIDGSLLLDVNMPNSLPEVLVPISTDTLDAVPIEMATNAADEIAFFKSSHQLGINGDYTNASVGVGGAEVAIAGAQTASTPIPPILPPPTEFGGGNPFLMFLCLTLLLQHRNTIMKSAMDYNEIAMHFDKMVRKHDVTRVLNQARRMYIDYLKVQNAYRQRLQATGDINQNSNALITPSTAGSTQRYTPSYASAATKS